MAGVLYLETADWDGGGFVRLHYSAETRECDRGSATWDEWAEFTRWLADERVAEEEGYQDVQ